MDELQIGRIPTAILLVTVFIEDISTGRIDSYDAQSNAAKIVKLDTSGIDFKRGQEYNLWITARDPGNDINDNLKITITNDNGDIVSDCLLIEFSEVFMGSIKDFVSHKIQVCDDLTP